MSTVRLYIVGRGNSCEPFLEIKVDAARNKKQSFLCNQPLTSKLPIKNAYELLICPSVPNAILFDARITANLRSTMLLSNRA